VLAGKEVAEAPHLLAGQRETCLWGEQLARHTISVIWRREPDADEKVLISLLYGTRCLVPFPYTLRIEPEGSSALQAADRRETSPVPQMGKKRHQNIQDFWRHHWKILDLRLKTAVLKV
jgi:hypothetical protein